MAQRDGFLRRTLEWFGFAETDEDYDEYEDEDVDGDGRGGRGTRGPRVTEPDDLYAERTNVRRLDSRRGSGRSMGADFDDIWSGGGDDRAASGGSTRATAVLRPAVDPSRPPRVRVHLIVPQGFNDAQQIADRFKDPSPVILNMQGVDTDLAKRLIDFASGLTYALDGGMQRVADRVFLLTPPNVIVSAEERERLAEGGFFNQS